MFKKQTTHKHSIQVRRSSVAPYELTSYLTRFFSNLNMPQISNLPVDCHYADLIVVWKQRAFHTLSMSLGETEQRRPDPSLRDRLTTESDRDLTEACEVCFKWLSSLGSTTQSTIIKYRCCCHNSRPDHILCQSFATVR